MIGVELEVLAKKFDRFGWDRDKGTPSHVRTLTDWMDALCDFPLDEIQAACRAAVRDNPNKMPNEGHIRHQVMAARKDKAAAFMAKSKPHEEYQFSRATDDEIESRKRAAAEILASFGFRNNMKDTDDV